MVGLRTIGHYVCGRCGKHQYYCIYRYEDHDSNIMEAWSERDMWMPPKWFNGEVDKVPRRYLIYAYMPVMSLREKMVEDVIEYVKRCKSRGLMFRYFAIDVIRDCHTSKLAKHMEVIIPENRIGSDVFNYGYPSAYFESCVSRMTALGDSVSAVYPLVGGQDKRFSHIRKNPFSQALDCDYCEYTPEELKVFEDGLCRIPENNRYYIGVGV